ncbi:MAG: DUF433 domain-containing protein [Candidatus Binatia bacterium]
MSPSKSTVTHETTRYRQLVGHGADGWTSNEDPTTLVPVRWQDHIAIDPDVLVGKPVVKGTRIAVEMVVDLLGRGYTVEQVLQQYDHLTRDDVQACLAYAAEVLQSEKVYALR